MKFWLSYLALVLFLIPVSCFAATYYVDWDDGKDSYNGLYSTYQDGKNGPWKSPWYADDQVRPGDTVIIYEKDDGSPYTNTAGGCTNLTLDIRTDNTNWQAAPGERPWFSNTGDNSTAPYDACGAFRGSNCGTCIEIIGDGVTIDGFYVWGNIYVNKADNVTIQNCDISGGCDRHDAFPDVLRTQGSPPDATPTDRVENLHVYNCKFHDNKPAFRYAKGVNCPLVMLYEPGGIVFENCEFTAGIHSAIYAKDDTYEVEIKNSWFHDIPVGLLGKNQSWPHSTWGLKIHHNVFSNISGAAIDPFGGTYGSFEIYNNTFYNCGADFGIWILGRENDYYYIFNNIHYHSKAGQYFHQFDSTWDMLSFAYLNYNHYYTDRVTTTWYVDGSPRASTLGRWKTCLTGQGAGSSNGDANSLDKDPKFHPNDGTVDGSSPADFKRSSYPADGRGGSYPLVVGAYVTGRETIGIFSNKKPE